ncbi:MAG: hypothetical protein ABJG68_02340 [Crocinitomicaceae bacterium]
MKRIFTLLVLTLTFAMTSFSQKSYVNYDKDSRWFFGLNGGATWHSRTETNNIVKGGYGFTFGHSFGMRPEKLFSWDLRFRYLHGWWKGQADYSYNLDSTSMSGLSNYGSSLQPYSDSIGYFIPNFRTQLLSGSLELALNTNRLRENTGWNFQIFGGIGVKGYNAQADLLNSSGQMYDYNTLSNTSQSSVLNLQDGNYETNITGTESNLEVDWMASFGAGLSYQIAPWASIGISHKMTWTRTNNQFDIMPNDNIGIPTAGNDIYHYSSAGIKFHLFGGNHGTTDPDPIETTDPNVFDKPNNNNNVTPPAPKQKPIVDIYDPGSSPYTTKINTFLIKANVHHVDGKSNITFKQDGNVNNNFSYNPATDKFQSSVVLHPGQNIFEITGTNSAGQDYESTIIIYEEEIPVIQPPIVTITNPSSSPYTTSSNVFNFASTVLNVDSKSQIKVYFNGAYMSNFTYNTSTKNLYATLNLLEGTNNITVTATNAAGSDSKSATIIYKRPAAVQPPIVDFIFPSIDPFVTSQAALNVTASVLNVASKNDITVKINGNTTTNFSYNANTKQVNFNVNLIEGANVLEVKGVNTAGMDYETTTIIYNKPEVPKPPIVTFIDPGQDPITVYQSNYNLEVKVEHVNSASDITLFINGIQSYNFAYSTSSKIMTFGTNLNVGANVIQVTGTNNVGSDIETTTINYRKVVPQSPPVVNITYPTSDGQVFNTPNVTLIASVLNVTSASNINVLVNGNTTTAFTYNTATKILHLPLTLVAGSNTISITGTNNAGSDNDTRVIVYTRPVAPAPPTVTYVNPPNTPHLVSVEDFTMTANTTNINSKSQISLLFNGNLVPDAQYTLTSTNQIIYNCDLIVGNNIFDIIVTNDDGSADAMAIVTYKKDEVPCIIPTVGYIHPVPYSTVNDPNVTIDAQINNHSVGTTVELLVNGTSQGYMTYNAGTSIASKATTLLDGSNAITVIVTNNCGTNQATFTLNYVAPEAPCVDPTVTVNGSTNVTTQEEQISISSGVSEITNATQIAASLNGSAVNFSFDAGTNTVIVENANLTLGNNTIIITATNECGTATLTYHILREACNPPIISGVTPSNNTVIPAATTTITANITNVIQSDIQLIVNGISQSFSYNANTGVLSAGVNLNEGANAIKIVATNSCETVELTSNITHTIPCQAITTSLLHPSALATTVTDENYSVLLHANGTLETSGISATLNGAAVPFTFDAIAGNISVNNLTLVDGTNTIVINLTNDCSNEAVTYTIDYDGCVPPTIEIPGINNGAVLNSGTTDFAAVIQNSNGANNIQLLLNGQVQSFDFDDQNNLLTAILNLNEGSNSIILTVNGCETANSNISVTYEVPCEPITYSLMAPAATTQTVVEAGYAVSLNIQNIENTQQLSTTLNGTAIAFNFDANTHTLSIPAITLVDGTNTIVVNAANDCSSETITYTVQYDGCQAPVITLLPNAAAASIASYPFSASVTNIANQSEIQVLLNGAPTSFVFDANTGAISGEATLIEGANTIEITANGCETDVQTINVTYTIPCDPIVVALSSPTQNETSVADELFTLNVVAQHAAASSILVKLNGTVVPHTFNNDVITSNLTLIDGDNTVEVTMSNPCSNETVNLTIHHDGCDAPVINLNGNIDGVTDAAYTFNAQVSNIDAANQITLTNNGSNVPFTFDVNTGQLTADITLSEGVNALVLNANGCVNSSANYNVTYTIPCNPVTYSLATPSSLNTVVDGLTTSISLNVTNVESSTNVSAQVNGVAATAVLVNNVITLADITLVDGTNTVTITFGNDCSSETVTYTIESDNCDSPIITVTNNNIVTNDPIFTFTCQVANITNGSDITVSVNGQVVNSNFAAGVLTAQMSLQEGANQVTIAANGCESTSVTYTVTYQVPCNPITYTHIMPQTNDTIHTNTPNLFVKLSTMHVEQANITVTLNGNPITFMYLGGTITINSQALQLGNNTLDVHMTNDCSTSDAFFHIVYAEDEPDCEPPVVSFTNTDPVVTNTAYTFTASVTNIDSANISLTHNGQAIPFTFANGQVTAQATLIEGINNFTLEAHGCEHVLGNWATTYTPPCDALTFGFITPATATVTDAAYAIELTSTNVDNPANVTASLNGTSIPAVLNVLDGKITLANIQLVDGANTILVNLSNECSNQIVEYVITYNEPAPEPCGPRFNPGNSDWQFCLVTDQGTYNRDDLANNANFSYAGTATAVYFKPIAGGGDAIVNGVAYPVQNGQYYLFEGNLTVDVSSSHPGSMGHWEICVNSDNVPTFGNGNNRPTSPCEVSNAPVDTGGGFDIDNSGNVHVEENYCATIQCLGESVIYNNSQDAYVSVEYSIDGGSTYYAFNNNNYVQGGEQTTVQTPAGSDIVIKATCVNQNGNWSNVEISNTSSQYVYVLKDGDQAPNFAPSQGQASVETFLAGLVDGNGNVSIGPNDVIYLFELRFVGNYGIDYQDCVMLITLDEGTNCPAPSNPTGSGGNHGQTYLTPVFENINPNALQMSSRTQKFDMKTKVKNVNDKTDLKLILNGKPITSFNYDISAELLTSTLSLVTGANTIKIEAKNGDKTNSITYNVNCTASDVTNPPMPAPVITNIAPSGKVGNVSSPAFNFKVKVDNVENKSKLKLIVNGAETSAFDYNTSTRILSANLNLVEGANVIKVQANGSSKAERMVTITYQKPAEVIRYETPIITNIQPQKIADNTAIQTYTFKAKVANVQSKSDVKVIVNGTPLSSFTYSTSTQMVIAVLRLNEGANSIKVEATNGDKSANRTYTVTYSKPAPAPKKPTIRNVAPSGSTSTVKSSTYMFKAQVGNVKGKGDVQLTVNGRAFTGFTFSSSTGQVTAVIKLNAGANSIKLTARNGSESASSSYTITYTPEVSRPSNGTTKPGGTGTSRPTTTGTTKPTTTGTTKPTTTGTTKPTTTGTTKPTTTGTTKPTPTTTTKPAPTTGKTGEKTTTTTTTGGGRQRGGGI